VVRHFLQIGYSCGGCKTAENRPDVDDDALASHAILFKISQHDVMNPHEVVVSQYAEGAVVNRERRENIDCHCRVTILRVCTCVSERNASIHEIGWLDGRAGDVFDGVHPWHVLHGEAHNQV